MLVTLSTSLRVAQQLRRPPSDKTLALHHFAFDTANQLSLSLTLMLSCESGTLRPEIGNRTPRNVRIGPLTDRRQLRTSMSSCDGNLTPATRFAVRSGFQRSL